MNRTTRPAQVLTIAGSDSGGGAGIQADLATFAAFGVHGLCAITAVTAQNTRGVTAIRTLEAGMLRAQLEAVFSDFRVGAIKLGMLATPTLVRTVAAFLQRHPRIPVVLDPVLVATTGARLATDDLVGAIHRHLLARSNLVTPNLPEAAALLGLDEARLPDRLQTARGILDLGARAVLLKGGHARGEQVEDLLLSGTTTRSFRHARIRGRAHGTGCTLSSAIAARLALGATLETAVSSGIDYVQRALRPGYRPGHGDLRVLDHGVSTTRQRMHR
jgi:hydroxymethylpyrimidine/phosphomethylpyrimidine kinase